MNELLGAFVFRLSTDSFDTPTNEISWTATGDNHIDVTHAFRPEVRTTIDASEGGLLVRVWSEQVPGKEYRFSVPPKPSHDKIVEIVGHIFTTVLGLHRLTKKDSWLDEGY